MMGGSCECMQRVLIWCNVGSCRRVSGVMGKLWLCAEGIWCDGGSCGCVLRVPGVMG